MHALLSLVESERAFAATSVSKGMRDAFLEFLAEDSILFRPGPVAGRKWMSDQPPRPGVLSWQPIFAVVATGGDLGYTTGPWEFRQDRADEQPAGHGHFISVWKKQADGQWKVALDTGIGCPPPPEPFAEWQPAPGDSATVDQPATQIDVAVERGRLLDVDRALSLASAQDGPGRAFLAHITDAARFYRAEMYPLLGRRQIESGLPERGRSLTWQPVSGDVARSGDLGYTYGTSELRATGPDGEAVEPGAYLRVWKKSANDEWCIVVDVANPFPRPAT